MVSPSQSLYLNRIDHLWGLREIRLGDYQEQSEAMHELWATDEEI